MMDKIRNFFRAKEPETIDVPLPPDPDPADGIHRELNQREQQLKALEWRANRESDTFFKSLEQLRVSHIGQHRRDPYP